MTEMVRMHGELTFGSKAAAAKAAAAFRGQCWDFCQDLLEVDEKVVRFDRTTDVPSDGLEGFEDAFEALASTAKGGRLMLDWRPDAPSKLGTEPEGEVDPWSTGLRHLIYPKHCLLVARYEVTPETPLSQNELVVAFRREPKYAKRYLFLRRRYSVAHAVHEGAGIAVALDPRHKLDFGKAAPAYGVVLYGEDRLEKTRLFGGELMVHQLVFSPDGTKLAGAAYKDSALRGGKRKGEQVLVWDLATGKAKRHKPAKKVVASLEWRDDQTLASPLESWTV